MGTNKRQSAPREALRFAVSGGACFLIEFAALSLLKKTGMPTLAANAIAFLISVALNYLLCVKWVFPQASDGGAAARAGSYVLLMRRRGPLYKRYSPHKSVFLPAAIS